MVDPAAVEIKEIKKTGSIIAHLKTSEYGSFCCDLFLVDFTHIFQGYFKSTGTIQRSHNSPGTTNQTTTKQNTTKTLRFVYKMYMAIMWIVTHWPMRNVAVILSL